MTLAAFLVEQRKLCPPNYKFLVARVKSRLLEWAEGRAREMFTSKYYRDPSEHELEIATLSEMRSRWSKPLRYIAGA